MNKSRIINDHRGSVTQKIICPATNTNISITNCFEFKTLKKYNHCYNCKIGKNITQEDIYESSN